MNPKLNLVLSFLRRWFVQTLQCINREGQGATGYWAHRSAHGSKFMVIRHCAPIGHTWQRALTRASGFARRCWLSVSVQLQPLLSRV